MAFNETEEPRLDDVDEADAGSHTEGLGAAPYSPSHAVTRPLEPESDDSIDLSDSTDHLTNITGRFAPVSQTEVVEKLYMKRQMRDNALAFKRKEMEYMQLQDCTFQPNIHLHQPEGNVEQFLHKQEAYAQRRKVHLAKLVKAKEKQTAQEEQEAVSARPQLSPGTRAILSRSPDSRPLLDRLLTPSKTREMVPDVSFSYHPLISPKAQRLQRDSSHIHESLSTPKPKPHLHSPAPKPPSYYSHKSQEMLTTQFRREFKAVCVEEEVGKEEFVSVVIRLKLGNELDREKIEESWRIVAGNREKVGREEVGKVLEMVTLRRNDTSADEQKAALQVLFTQMHKVRLTSPPRPPSSPQYSHQPHINPASHSLSRPNFTQFQANYQSQIAAKRQKQALEAEKAVNSLCSFSPKVNSSKKHSQNRQKSPRFEELYEKGVKKTEERRLLPEPDHEFERNKSELTFHPKRFSSASPKKTEENPKNYDEAVSRLKMAFAKHEDLIRRLTHRI